MRARCWRSCRRAWPLATAPSTLARNDNADAELNEWILAWVAHQLPRSPAHLFEANIFYPEHDSLAFSEPLIVPALMGAPLHWLGASPVFVFNIVLLLGFALTAWAGYVLAFEWTGDRAAGMLAASMFAFNTHTLTRLAHVQGIHAWGLALTLLSADRILVHARWRDAVWLAVWMTAMAYTSGYLIVFGAVMVAVVLVARVPDWWPRTGRIVMLFAGATLLAGVAILPVYLPYRRVAKLGLTRPIESVTEYSATLTGYLAAAGRIHFSTWSGRFWANPVDGFFPGFVVIILAAVAIYWGGVPWLSGVRSRWSRVQKANARQSRSDPSRPEGGADFNSGARTSDSARLSRRRIVMLVAIAATGMILSLGTRTPVYGWLYQVFPPMQGLRAAARFGNLFLLGMAVLAAFGLAGLRNRLPTRWAGVVAVGLVIVANIESLRAPIVRTLRRHSGHLFVARSRARPSGPRRSPVLPAAGRIRERPLCPQLDGPLAAADERIQRLHTGIVLPGMRTTCGTSRRTGQSRRCAAPGRHARDGAPAALPRGRGVRNRAADEREARARAARRRPLGPAALPAALTPVMDLAPASGVLAVGRVS